jgi:hypothetical protein
MFKDAQHKKYNLMNDTWCLYAIVLFVVVLWPPSSQIRGSQLLGKTRPPPGRLKGSGREGEGPPELQKKKHL